MNLFSVIIFGVVVGIVIFLAVRLSNRLQSKSQPTAAQPSVPANGSSEGVISKTGAEIIQDFLTQTACLIDTVETSDEWTYHVFQYQGAYFESYSNNTTDEVLIYYPSCLVKQSCNA